MLYAFFNHTGVINVVRATMMITVVLMFEDKAPEGTPMPATMSLTPVQSLLVHAFNLDMF